MLLNGKKVGVTPLEIKELPVGNYHLEIWKEYYVKEFATVKIAEDQEWKESGELKLTEFGELIVNAENGSEGGIVYSWPISLAQYYRYGAACGIRGDHYTCEEDSAYVSINPVKAIYWLKKTVKEGSDFDSNEAKELLGPSYPSIADDALLSFAWAKRTVEDNKDFAYYQMSGQWKNLPFAALAWHYFYGIGCDKNINEAKKLMRWACLEDGRYYYPAYKELIKAMGLDGELKYISQKEWIKKNTITE